MTEPVLSPVSNEYLTSRVRFNQLTDNKVDLDINSTDFEVGTTPKVSTFGDGKVYLEGTLKLTGPGSAGIKLATLPSWCMTSKTVWLPVLVMNAGIASFNAIRIDNKGDSIESVDVTDGGTYTTAPTASVTSSVGFGAILEVVLSSKSLPTLASPGTSGYAPGDKLTVSGGTSTEAAKFNIKHTTVISATIVSGGTGGTDGSKTVTGTTGTGTKFQASVTIAGGAITSVDSISVGGAYTANPTDISNEPVTGASLSGAVLSVSMAIGSITADTAGSYSTLPVNPVSTTTDGGGSGATLTMDWEVTKVNVTDGGQEYQPPVTITFSSGDAKATANLTDDTGAIELVNSPMASDEIHLDGISFDVQSYKGQ